MTDDIGLLYKRQEIYWVLVAIAAAAKHRSNDYHEALQDAATAFGISAQLRQHWLVEMAHEAD